MAQVNYFSYKPDETFQISRTYVNAGYYGVIHMPSSPNWVVVVVGRDSRTTWNLMGQLSWSASFSDEDQADFDSEQCGW